jgi:hypothetical protein
MELFLLKYYLCLCRAKRHSEKDDAMPCVLTCFLGNLRELESFGQGCVNYQLFIVYAFSSPLSIGKIAAGGPSCAQWFGCLGNRETYTETEDSITRLFAAVGIRILRQERLPIQSHGEAIMTRVSAGLPLAQNK